MSLLIAEHTIAADAELLLPGTTLLVTCRLTAEWLRGIAEPTWYGYLTPHRPRLSVLPGYYRLRLHGATLVILVRRATRVEGVWCLPFWGVGPLSEALHPVAPTPDDAPL
ncbi:MAG: hypothetical protein C4290_15430 [Chloroflexota bacterium]